MKSLSTCADSANPGEAGASASNTLALCIPAYNAARYLPRLLRAAHMQEGPPFDEIFVYDDCSTDDTASVARSYGATVLRGDVNRGCSFGKNVLAKAASTHWIHFIDADDMVLPNYTRLAHKWMAMPNAPDVVLFNYEWRDEETGELLQVRNFDDARLQEDPLRYAIQEAINNFNIYRRERFLAAGGFDDDRAVSNNEDQAMHIRMARAGLRFRAETEVAAISYRVKNSMTSNRGAVVRAHYLVMARTAAVCDQKYHGDIAEQLWHNAGHAAACSRWDVAAESVALARYLGVRAPRTGSIPFRLLASVAPMGAVRFREWTIRKFKADLRIAAT